MARRDYVLIYCPFSSGADVKNEDRFLYPGKWSFFLLSQMYGGHAAGEVAAL